MWIVCQLLETFARDIRLGVVSDRRKTTSKWEVPLLQKGVPTWEKQYCCSRPGKTRCRSNPEHADCAWGVAEAVTQKRVDITDKGTSIWLCSCWVAVSRIRRPVHTAAMRSASLTCIFGSIPS